MSVELSQTTFTPPFTEQTTGRGRVRSIGGWKHAGIYLIKENGVIVYVGMSAYCVVKALYRHFYRWANDPTRKTRFPRVTYVNHLEDRNYEVCVMKCSKDDAPKIERGLIIAIKPRDNRERYEFYLDELVRSRSADPADAPDPDAAPTVNPDDPLPF